MKYKLLTIACFISFISFSQQVFTEDLIITPEKTNYQKTSTYAEVMLFIEALEKKSDNIWVTSLGVSKEGKQIPLVVLSNPKVTSLKEAKKLNKPIIFAMGNIHAGEVEGKEILQQLMRDILLGNKKHLLENQILLFAPIYNTDSNDKMEKGRRPSQEDSPIEVGLRASSEGYDLNRDGIKMEALETKGLIKNVLVKWNPELLIDLHTTNGTWHGYDVTYAPSYHSIGEASTYNFTKDKLLPIVTKNVKQHFDINMGHYGYYFIRNGWPPKAIYTYNHHPRYLVNYMGLRNKMGILSEAFAHNRFYKRMIGTYAFVNEILNFTNENSSKIVEINNKAEEDAIKNVLENAGKISKGVRFKKVALDNKISDYKTYDYIPYITNKGDTAYVRSGNIVSYKVDNFAKFKPTLTSKLPRGYYIPKAFEHIIIHLKKHGIKVEKLKKSKTVLGEDFLATNIQHNSREFEGHFMVNLEGDFVKTSKTFIAGDYYIDMAQPLTNLIFYMLEPQSDDGLVTWNFFDEYFRMNYIENKPVAYPIFKHF
ncbi:MAG TPA: M14 family metallopeptidase [Flavobacteriaceae bacterium]|nr:M14 family metallopeptidase [Flavobacteriaceae bacterium]